MSQIRSETRQFSFDELQPGKTYRAVVRAFDAENKRIGRSASIEFKTKEKDTAPPEITNLVGDYNGSSLELSWDYESFPSDFSGFIVTVSENQGISAVFDTAKTKYLSLSYINILNLFNTIPSTLDISVVASDRSGNQSAPVTISLTIGPTPDPTNVVISPAVLGYNVSWDDPSFSSYSYTAIYESSTSDYSDEQLVYTLSTSPSFVPSSKNSDIYVRVSHFSRSGLESNRVPSDPTSIVIQNPAVVDETPPEQRLSISYSPGVGQILVEWENPTNEENNADLAGVAIRYAKVSDPNNFIWVNVPYSFSENITSYTVTNLIPNTDYSISIASYDKTQNYSEYSNPQTVTTLSDDVPPSKPVPPSISAGSSSGGPMIVRVSQYSIKDGTGTPPLGEPLESDLSYFKVFMLNDTFTTSPPPGVVSDDNTSEIGTIVAGFNGSRSQFNFFVPLEEGETRYFYTRPVDSSGNIGDASDAVESNPMLVLSDAYISDLSADKISTGTLGVNRYIDIGPTSEARIRIENFQDLLVSPPQEYGRIFSGAAPGETNGGYAQSGTGFYLDHTGKFSLKDKLRFDGSNLIIDGSISIRSGTVLGNLGIISGSIWIGDSSYNPSNPLPRIIINNSSIGSYDNSNTIKFLLTNSGTSQIGGWTFTTTQLNSPGNGIVLNSSTKRITVGSGTTVIGLNGDGSVLSPINSTTNSAILMWAGTNSPSAWSYDSDLGKVVPSSSSSNLIITENGNLYANNATFSGYIYGSAASFSSEGAIKTIDPSNPSINISRFLEDGSTLAPNPTVEIIKVGNSTGDLGFIKNTGTNQGIKFYVKGSSSLTLRGSLDHRSGSGTLDAGGKLYLSAYKSISDNTPGILIIEAQDTSSNESGRVVIDARKTYIENLFFSSNGNDLAASDPITNFWKDPSLIPLGNSQNYFRVGSASGSAINVRKLSDGSDKVTIRDYDIEGDNSLINNSKINVGGIQIGRNLNSTNKDGIYVDANNFWYDPDSVSSSAQYFKVGNSAGTNFIILEKDGDIKFKGNITGGNFSGNVSGPVPTLGDLDQNVVKIGVDVLDTSDGISFNRNNFWLVPSTVDTGNTIFKIASGGPNSTTTYIEVVKGGEVKIKGHYQGGEIQGPLPTTPTPGGESLTIGKDVDGDKDGIKLNADNFWYLPTSISDGSDIFRVGSSNNFISYNEITDILSVTGEINANTGSIGGWDIGSNIISSSIGTYPIKLDASTTTPKIYIGAGAHASITTPFYADAAGRFSIGDKLFFDPSGTEQFGALTVIGRIRGAVDNVQIVPPDSGTFTVSQVVISGISPDQSAIITTSSSHTFAVGDTVIISGLSGNTIPINGAWAIASKTADTFTINGISNAINGTYTGLTGFARVRELTMGLHAALNGSPAGLGIRLDENNYWFVNNQFRVGTSGSYFKWDGTTLEVKGKITADSGTFPAGLITGQITASQINATGLTVSGAVNTQYLNTVGGADSFNVRIASSPASSGNSPAAAFVGFFNATPTLLGLINSNANNSLNISGISTSSDVTLQSNRNLYLRSTSDMIVMNDNIRGSVANTYYRPTVISTSGPNNPGSYVDGTVWIVY